jgi:hypothetical protein
MDKENSVLPVFKLAMEDVATADLKESADRLELEYDEGIHIDFLLKSYVVTNEGVFKRSGEQASQITSALLIQYCLSNTTSRPTGEFVSMSQLAGPGSGIGSYFANDFATAMDKKFSNDIEKLERAAFKLGAKKDDVLLSGGVSFIFEILKHLPVKLVFYPADDEFSAGGSILLDASATDFLGFETLAFLLSIFLRKLTEKDF